MVHDSRKSLVVTGCSEGGIGHTCARMARKAGYRVFATARRAEEVAKLRDEGFESFPLDLDDTDSIDEAVDWVRERTDGKLYALFNNAAYGQPGAVEDLSRDALRAQFETNLFGTHELTVKLLPLLLASKEARIVQNSSVLGFVALRYRGAYNASKFALEGLTDTLRLELEGTGVKVSLIEPGPIHSRFRQNALKKFLENIDREGSRLAAAYEKKLEALTSDAEAPFTLGPEAVGEALLHALKSPRPKIRYRVTGATHLFYWLKKVSPERWMERILSRVE